MSVNVDIVSLATLAAICSFSYIIGLYIEAEVLRLLPARQACKAFMFFVNNANRNPQHAHPYNNIVAPVFPLGNVNKTLCCQETSTRCITFVGKNCLLYYIEYSNYIGRAKKHAISEHWWKSVTEVWLSAGFTISI